MSLSPNTKNSAATYWLCCKSLPFPSIPHEQSTQSNSLPTAPTPPRHSPLIGQVVGYGRIPDRKREWKPTDGICRMPCFFPPSPFRRTRKSRARSPLKRAWSQAPFVLLFLYLRLRESRMFLSLWTRQRIVRPKGSIVMRPRTHALTDGGHTSEGEGATCVCCIVASTMECNKRSRHPVLRPAGMYVLCSVGSRRRSPDAFCQGESVRDARYVTSFLEDSSCMTVCLHTVKCSSC